MFLNPGAKLARKVDVNASLYNTIAQTRGESAAARSVSACRAFQNLRAALHEPPTTESVRNGVTRYLAALEYVVTEKGVPSETAVELLWVNAFDGDDVAVLNDLKLDRVAALFNLAVCETHLATTAFRTRRADPGAMKLAARHFQTAAGYFKAAADLPSPGGIRKVTCDLYPPALKALEYVMLGNAQQALYEIALEMGNSNAIMAKYAIGTRDFYLIAQETCRDPDVVNTCINGYVGRPAGALAAYFDVVAQSAQANACSDNHNMPEQLTRISMASKSVQTGLATVASLDTTSLASVATLKNKLIDALNALQLNIKNRKDDAEKENRTVYFCSPAPSCPPITGRQSVKPSDISVILKKDPVDERLKVLDKLPEPLSTELTGVAAWYSDMVARTVAEEVSAINTNAVHLQEIIIKVEKCISSTRASIAAESARPVSSQPDPSSKDEQKAIDVLRDAQEGGGVSRLSELQSEVLKLATEVKLQVQGVEGLLHMEDNEDRQLRSRIHVTRPTSASLSHPYLSHLQTIRGEMEQAANADLIVKDQIERHATGMREMEQEDIRGFTAPTARPTPPPSSRKAERAEAIISEMQPKIETGKHLLSEKNSVIQDFEKKKHLENPYAATSGIPDGDTERCDALIKQGYGSLQQRGTDMRAEMETVAQFLSDANVRLTLPAPVQTNDKADGDKQKMINIYKHQASAQKCKELLSHLKDGVMFYTIRQDTLSALRRDVEGFVAARRAEAQDLLRVPQYSSGSGYPPQGNLYPSGPHQ